MSFKDWIFNFMEKPKITKPNGEVVDTITGEIKSEIFYKELAIYTAITLIANAISKCEIKTYENKEEVKDKYYYALNQNSSQFWHKVIEKMVYDGETIAIDLNDKLYCVDSYSVNKYPILGNKYNGVTIDNLQLNKVFTSEEVLLFN